MTSLPLRISSPLLNLLYGGILQAFPDASMEINEQIAERDLVTTRKTLRGTHVGTLWDLPPTGNHVELEFIDIFRVADVRHGDRSAFVSRVGSSPHHCGDHRRSHGARQVGAVPQDMYCHRRQDR